MFKTLLYLAIILLPSLGWSQKSLVWQVLGMTTYNNDFKDGEDSGMLIPNFPSILITQYEGQEVVISGYIIPIDIESNKYALSKNPFTSCFFCGNAGPETVIELRFTDPPGRFVTDEYLMIKGILELNRDGTGLFFTLTNAEIHG